MLSWTTPQYVSLNGQAQPLKLYDTADNIVKPVEVPESSDTPVGMYVCGITPYDSTHLGHAATYVTFDLITRQLMDNGYRVSFVENITDVDEPLFERAERDGVDWIELGTDQINLFRSDMEALQVFPPTHYIGAMEAIPEVKSMVHALLDIGAAYNLEVTPDNPYADIYMDHTFTPQFGYESRYTDPEMMKYFAERGGDPERPGKRHPLDALLWRLHRDGEPSWDAEFGAGRPGWHVECSAIATHYLGDHFAIQGGGEDLRFPHHEYSAAHAEATYHTQRMAGHYVHTGMIAQNGVKMSKSLGNLEFVSRLLKQGYPASTIRLGIYANHYRSTRDWSVSLLKEAEERLQNWSRAYKVLAGKYSGSPQDAALPVISTALVDLVQNVRTLLSQDLNTPEVLAAIDSFTALVMTRGAEDLESARTFRIMMNSLLGIELLETNEPRQINPQAILWDMDGTLVDSEPLWGKATYSMAEAMGTQITPEIRESTVGGTTRNTILTVAHHAGLSLTEDEIQYWYDWMMNAMKDLLPEVEFLPGVEELLEDLASRGIPMAVVTNTARELADVVLNTINKGYFTTTICGDEVEHGKPHPEPYLNAAASLRMDPAQILIVEDSQAGMQAAAAAGATVIGVPEDIHATVPQGVVPLSELKTDPSTPHFEGITGEKLLECYSQLSQSC